MCSWLTDEDEDNKCCHKMIKNQLTHKDFAIKGCSKEYSKLTFI